MLSSLEIVMIDNYDSFTYNLVNQFRLLGCQVVVFRNDTPIDAIFTPERLAANNTVLVISPGPGNPDSAGNTLAIIEQFAGRLPILGICLGHQAIVQSLGGTVGPSDEIVHGKADYIQASAHPVFANLPQPFQAARYHSLIATDLPESLDVIATASNQIMAVKHRDKKILGFQFHPESILTTFGSQLLEQSLAWLSEQNNQPQIA